MSWKAIAFSEAGKSHQKSGLTCQDYAQFIKLNDFGEIVNDGDIIIGVVSKGSEGYKHSDIGSQLAIETTLNYLQDRIKFVGVNELLDISKEEAGLVIQQLFLQTVETVSKNLNIKSQDLRCYPQDLSCGLLVVLATPKWLATMRIGDGFIVVQQADSEYQLLFEPIKQKSANKTNILPANNASELLEFKMHDGQELIFVSTDNLQVLAFDVRGESKLNPYFFDSLRQAIINSSESQVKEIIKNIFNPKKLKNFKNTTLTFLLCFYKSPFAELNDRNQILTQEVNRLYNELSDLQLYHKQLTEQLEKSRQELSDLCSYKDKLIEQNSEFNGQILALISENKSLKTEIQQQPYQNQALTKEISELNQRLSTLHLENQSLKKKIKRTPWTRFGILILLIGSNFIFLLILMIGSSPRSGTALLILSLFYLALILPIIR